MRHPRVRFAKPGPEELPLFGAIVLFAALQRFDVEFAAHGQYQF